MRREAPGVGFSKGISGLIKIKLGRNPSTGDTFALRVYSLPRTINPVKGVALNCTRRPALEPASNSPGTNLHNLLWARS